MCKRSCGKHNRCAGRNFSSKFVYLLDQMEITPFQKEMIKSRFVTEVNEIEFDYARSVVLFIGLTNLVTVAGILITSFTTLTKATNLDLYWQNVLSWLVWMLSLMLTLANGWLTTFGIYKKYVLCDVTLEKMYNEGWSFIAGVNRYDKLSLDDRCNVFCSKIEQIITKTTIKQLSDNTAGVNVHEVLEVENPAEKQSANGLSVENSTVVGTAVLSEGTISPESTISPGGNRKDVVISIPQDNIRQPKRKKKIRK